MPLRELLQALLYRHALCVSPSCPMALNPTRPNPGQYTQTQFHEWKAAVHLARVMLFAIRLNHFPPQLNIKMSLLPFTLSQKFLLRSK